jgi:heme/copper-type cytochrome/quinol oxidase subunit 1
LGQNATFSALSAAEMRFFKTHGFVKPLLREMLFLFFGHPEVYIIQS